MDKEQIKQIIADQRELIQNDLQCLLDGFDNKLIDAACEVIVTRMNALSIILTTG